MKVFICWYINNIVWYIFWRKKIQYIYFKTYNVVI